MPEETTNDQQQLSYAERRIAICQECPEYKLFVCTKCGCMMPVKTRLRGASCPLNKWGPEN